MTLIIYINDNRILHVQNELKSLNDILSVFAFLGSKYENAKYVYLQENTTKKKFNIKYYIFEDSIFAKETMTTSINKTEIVANGIDKATISNCPENAVVSGDLAGTVGVDGLIEVTASVPKEINIKLVLYPYLNKEITINAT